MQQAAASMRCAALRLDRGCAARALSAPCSLRRQARAQRCAAVASHVASHASRTPLLDALPESQKRQMEAYVQHLLDWNENRSNLVAASQATRDQARAAVTVMVRHVEDALALLPVVEAALPEPNAAVRLVDVGSGAGFPGMVLAIARPSWRVTLVESLGKRTRFLDEVAQRAPVPNVRTLWARAEDVGRDATMRECSDVVVARAVAELRVLAELCLPLARVGGVWVAQKNAAPEQEVADARRAVALLGGGALSVERVATLGPDGLPFTAVTCRKERPCDAQYPREAGTPKRQPL